MGEEYVFEKLGDALYFAFRFRCDAQNQMITDVPSSGGGLKMSSVDGAAQAGMIQYHSFELGKVMDAALAARFGNPFDDEAPRCECCGHQALRAQWVGSCVLLATEVAMPSASSCHERLARELVRRHFLPKQMKRSFASIAAQFGEGEDKVKKVAGKVGSALRVVESKAQSKIGDILCETGVVKSTYKQAA